MSVGRLIPLDPGGPAENMAVDQALLESADELPLLRLYQWRQPTLSLGYFQRLVERDSHPESESIVCVRRATGGGAIVHHHEVTYSIVMPDRAAGPSLKLYRQIHQAWIDAFAGLGIKAQAFRQLATPVPSPSSTDAADGDTLSPSPSVAAGNNSFLCFQRRTDEDLIVHGYKVLGSAQRKSRGRILQHGSLLLRTSRFAPQLPGVSELAGRAVSAAEIADLFRDALAASWNLTWRTKPLQPLEQQHADQIREQKFAHPRWLQRR